MDPYSITIVTLAVIVTFYMAWNIGANDVANAMGTSVGSKALTLKQAVVIAAIFEFAGAFIAGDAVTDTVRKGILTIDFETINSDFATKLFFGFIAALMAAASWITIATRLGLPVSTTHSIIGGIVGIGLLIDASIIDWGVVMKVVGSWVASPLLGAILGFVTFMVVRKSILNAPNPLQRSRWLAPMLAIPTFFVLGLALQFKALKGLFKRLDRADIIDSANWLPVKENGSLNPLAENAWFPINSLLLALAIALIASGILWAVVRKHHFEGEGYHGVEKIFVWLQVITAAYVAFAHGANDRSNAIGPMAAIFQIWESGGVLMEEAPVPLWLILLGSLGIAIGVMTWGWRVMMTIGKKITDITPTRGFAAEFAAATTILLFSMPFLAVPVSTTHTLVGAVVGVGLAGGASAVDFRVFGKIAASWVASLPAAGGGAIILYFLFGGNALNIVIVLVAAFGLIGYLMYKTRGGDIHVEDALVVSEHPMTAKEAAGEIEAPTVFQQFQSHAKAVERTVDKMLEAVNRAAKGEDCSKWIEKVSESELEADTIKNAMRDRVGTGYQIVIGNHLFLQMLTRQDRIADYAQNVAEQLSFRELYDDPTAKKNLVDMAELVHRTVEKYVETVDELIDLSLSGYARREKENLHRLISEVNELEHEADLVESKAAGYVFSTGDDDPLAAMHMYRVLQRLDDVANSCEAAANEFLAIVYGKN